MTDLRPADVALLFDRLSENMPTMDKLLFSNNPFALEVDLEKHKTSYRLTEKDEALLDELKVNDALCDAAMLVHTRSFIRLDAVEISATAVRLHMEAQQNPRSLYHAYQLAVEAVSGKTIYEVVALMGWTRKRGTNGKP